MITRDRAHCSVARIVDGYNSRNSNYKILLESLEVRMTPFMWRATVSIILISNFSGILSDVFQTSYDYILGDTTICLRGKWQLKCNTRSMLRTLMVMIMACLIQSGSIPQLHGYLVRKNNKSNFKYDGSMGEWMYLTFCALPGGGSW